MMQLRLVHEELQKCYRAEGENHYQVCHPLAKLYDEMLKETKVCVQLKWYSHGLVLTARSTLRRYSRTRLIWSLCETWQAVCMLDECMYVRVWICAQIAAATGYRPCSWCSCTNELPQYMSAAVGVHASCQMCPVISDRCPHQRPTILAARPTLHVAAMRPVRAEIPASRPLFACTAWPAQ